MSELKSEFRYCKLDRNWVLFAPNRLRRPIEFIEEELKDSLESCPFEKGRENLTPKEIYANYDKSGWRCRVVPNLYNALFIEEKPISSRDGFFTKFGGFGAHEVIIETPYHNRQMPNFTQSDFYFYLDAIRERLFELQKDKRIKYISIFKNSGKNAGASLSHSHSQLIGMPFIPEKVKKELEYKRSYFLEKHRTLFDDIIYDEKHQKSGIIEESQFFIAYSPYASKFPFEVIITTKLKKISLIYFDNALLRQLAEILSIVFKKLSKTLGIFSFNMTINNAPFINYELANIEDIYRFHIKIMPRLYNIAGFELDSGIFINPLLPEEATKALNS